MIFHAFIYESRYEFFARTLLAKKGASAVPPPNAHTTRHRLARLSSPAPRRCPIHPHWHSAPALLACRGQRSRKRQLRQVRRRSARQGRHRAPARRSRWRLADCLGGALGPPSLSNHVLSGGEINLQVSFAVEGLLPRRLGVEFLDGFVRGKRFIASRVDRLCFKMLNLGVDRFTQPSLQRSPSKKTPLFGVNNHLYLDCAPVLGVWLQIFQVFLHCRKFINIKRSWLLIRFHGYMQRNG